MEFYTPRKLRFKAWNKEAKLIMRLDSMDCTKGELTRKGHVLLQFTGVMDKHSEELYELDIVLIDSVKYVIRWSDERCGWCYVAITDNNSQLPLTIEGARKMIRLCNYFESAGL